MEDAQRREIALFRYALVRQAADPALTNTERGRLVCDLAGRDHAGPDGQRRRVARSTIDEWIRAYRTGGFDGLVPAPGSRQPRTAAEVLALAVSLKEERPGRTTAAQIRQVMLAAGKTWTNTSPTNSASPSIIGLATSPSSTPLTTTRPANGPNIPPRPATIRYP